MTMCINWIRCANDNDDTHWTLEEREWLAHYGIDSQHFPCGCDDGPLEDRRELDALSRSMRRNLRTKAWCVRCNGPHEYRQECEEWAEAERRTRGIRLHDEKPSGAEPAGEVIAAGSWRDHIGTWGDCGLTIDYADLDDHPRRDPDRDLAGRSKPYPTMPVDEFLRRLLAMSPAEIKRIIAALRDEPPDEGSQQ